MKMKLRRRIEHPRKHWLASRWQAISLESDNGYLYDEDKCLHHNVRKAYSFLFEFINNYVPKGKRLLETMMEIDGKVEGAYWLFGEQLDDCKKHVCWEYH